MLRLTQKIMLLSKVVTSYIGCVIGAGFASGQEIMQFFILHGNRGLLGVALAAVLFAYLGGLVMFLAIRMRSTNYLDLLSFVMGPAAGKVMDILNLLMLLGGLSVMMAGSAAVFGEEFGLPARSGIWSLCVLTTMVILGGLDGVLAANVILVPIKFLAIVLIACVVIIKSGNSTLSSPFVANVEGVAGHWFWAGFLYVSYNMVVPVAVLSSLGRVIPLKIGIAGGVIGGLLLGLAVSMVTLAGLLYLPELSSCQIPLLYLAGRLGWVFHLAIGFLIWLAILTSAIADAHGIASRLAPGGGARYRVYGTGACLLALPLASYSFSELVRLLYPAFGCAGLVLMACLLIVPVIKFCKSGKNDFHIL
ncbi:MAG: hypothetical protein A4E55_00566 [Pelotomaculum sp. PtaU1.Bin035]|nr:MAG: hypothetical protein A4E55_00566 [Pelotomaculum sp. PtaU1.Bin035]